MSVSNSDSVSAHLPRVLSTRNKKIQVLRQLRQSVIHLDIQSMPTYPEYHAHVTKKYSSLDNYISQWYRVCGDLCNRGAQIALINNYKLTTVGIRMQNSSLVCTLVSQADPFPHARGWPTKIERVDAIDYSINLLYFHNLYIDGLQCSPIYISYI